MCPASLPPCPGRGAAPAAAPMQGCSIAEHPTRRVEGGRPLPFTQRWRDFFRKPWRLPLVVLLLLMTIGVPRIAGEVLRTHAQLGVDLQKYKCLPYTVYLFLPGRVNAPSGTVRNIPLTRGRVVAFVEHDNIMGLPELDGQRIVKVVAGLPGDLFEVRQGAAYINGVKWGDLTLLRTLNRPAQFFDRREVIPPGKVLLMGTTPYAYDGRYFGPIEQAEIRAEARPIF